MIRAGPGSRGALLRSAAVEVFPYTPEEFDSERARKNPIVLEARDIGIDLLKEDDG